MANITRSWKHYKPSFLENDHPGRDIGERSKPMEPKGKEYKEEEDMVLTQLKKTQAHVSVWGLLMASYKHCSALLDALNGRKVSIETTLQEVLSLIGVKAPSHPLLAFSDEDLPSEGATYTRPLQITIECMGAKVLVVLIDNGSALNVCPLRTTLIISLDMETIIPSPLTIRAYNKTSRKIMGTYKALCKIGPIGNDCGVPHHNNYNLLLGKAWLHPIGDIPSSLNQKMKIPWKGGIAIILGDGEILALVSGIEEGGSELQMSGIEFVNMVNYELKNENYTTDLLPYFSHEVITMMKNMGYMPSMGLGKEGKEVVEFPDFKTQLTNEGLGFFEGCDGIKKNLGTLNGNFVKEGGDFPFCGFPELWVGKDGKVYLG